MVPSRHLHLRLFMLKMISSLFIKPRRSLKQSFIFTFYQAKMAQRDLRIRLLVKSAVKPTFIETKIDLNGEQWHLAEFIYNATMDRQDLPSFACISYRWFGGRKPNPFYKEKYMSNLTLPSLATAMRNTTA